MDDNKRQQLAVAARIDPLNWTVIVEQPTSEAYASATRLTRQLAVAAVLALLIMMGLGLLFGRRFIAPFSCCGPAHRPLPRASWKRV